MTPTSVPVQPVSSELKTPVSVPDFEEKSSGEPYDTNKSFDEFDKIEQKLRE